MTIHLGVEDGGMKGGWMEGGRGPCLLLFPSVSPCPRSASHINTHNGRRRRLRFSFSRSFIRLALDKKRRGENLGKFLHSFLLRLRKREGKFVIFTRKNVHWNNIRLLLIYITKIITGRRDQKQKR